MKSVNTFRIANGLLGGFLIGVSIVIPVFAMTVADPGGNQMVWIIGAAFVLALGFTLQGVVSGAVVAARDDPEVALPRLDARIKSPRSITTIAAPQSDGRSEELMNTSFQHKTSIRKCSSCGALLAVLPDMERFACKYCTAEHIVVRREGTTALKRVAETI